MTVSIRLGISALILWVAGTTAVAAALPQQDGRAHLGVASCASGVCHGSVTPRSATAVLQNEYVTWSRRDRHRVAYDTLRTERSGKIAGNLGLPNAFEAKICLDCHADNVPEPMRGEKFVISDGVGCEACHGGAEQYISAHTDKATSREERVQAGLYRTDDPVQRARLCLSCHLGTADKAANHRIMGAGHPRLAFELDTFGILQPAHYVVDEDYRSSKWFGSSLTVWVIGQTISAQQTLSLIGSTLETAGRFPELSLFDCHACHHPMSNTRWTPGRSGNLPPGSVRLNDANFIMLGIIAGAVSSDLASALQDSLNQLHRAVNNGQPLDGLLTGLTALVGQIEQIASASVNPQFGQALLEAVINEGSQGRYQDYAAAEQAVMAVDMLLSVTNQRDSQEQWLDSVYRAVSAEDGYEADTLRDIMRQFKP